MLLRDAQEETRVLYAARRDSKKNKDDLLLAHMAEASSMLRTLESAKRQECGQTSEQKQRTVGLILLVGLGLANEAQVDSLEALKSVLLQESP